MTHVENTENVIGKFMLTQDGSRKSFFRKTLVSLVFSLILLSVYSLLVGEEFLPLY